MGDTRRAPPDRAPSADAGGTPAAAPGSRPRPLTDRPAPSAAPGEALRPATAANASTVGGPAIVGAPHRRTPDAASGDRRLTGPRRDRHAWAAAPGHISGGR